MFQRQTTPPFPVRNILIIAVMALILLGYSLQKNREVPLTDSSGEPEKEAAEHQGSGLWPDEWQYLIREYPDFKPGLRAYKTALTRARDGVQSRGNNPGFNAPWTIEGPGNIGSRVNTIKADPTNPDIIYIGYCRGGVWKTIDGGLSWNPIFDGQNALAIGDIELDPQNPNIVYVGTGDPNISGYPFVGDGLWKSTDAGTTWKYLGLENQRIISKIIIHPTNPNILYVGTMGLPFTRNNERGLYKSSNGGQTWEQVLFVSNASGVIDLQMSGSDPNTLYASVWDRIRNNQESFVTGNNARIWKTTNGGNSWTKLEGGLPQNRKSRIGLSISANDPNFVLAVVVDSTLDMDNIYKTTDAGASWSPLPQTGLDAGFMGGFGWYFGKVFINPFDDNDLYVCGIELWRSVDGGENWFITTPEWWTYEVHADKHDLAFIDANTVLLATDGGLYRSSDSGQSWAKIENNPTSQFYRVAFNPFQPDWYIGGMQDNGTAGGDASIVNDWPRLFGGDGFQAVYHPEDPNVFYYETQNGTIYGVDMDGNVNSVSGTLTDDRRDWDMPYFISPNNYEVMYAGTYRVQQSYGHPPNWFPVSPDLTDGIIYGSRYHVITTVHESSLETDLLYAGTSDANVWRGNPTQQDWVNISAGLPERFVSSVKASPNLLDRVYVTQTGYKDNDPQPHLHRSDDRGNTWTNIAGNLPGFAIYDVLIMPGHQDSIIFVGTDGGVYGTINGGQHWERLGTGMPFVPVFALTLNPVLKTLVAGTHARSIMTFPLDSIQLGNNVSTFTPGGVLAPSLRVLPNLVTDHANLVLKNLPSRRQTAIFITNAAGKVVWEEQFTGLQAQETPIDLADLAAGVYFAFARSDGRIWGQSKFVVVK